MCIEALYSSVHTKTRPLPARTQTANGMCGCTHYENGAHPVTHKAHMCVTAYPIEENGVKTGEDRRVCKPPSQAYEARYGEALMNFGCDHPA